MKPHPSEQQLRQWLDGSLDEAECRVIEAHIETCPDVCQLLLDKMPAGAIARTRELRLSWSGRLARDSTEAGAAVPQTSDPSLSPESLAARSSTDTPSPAADTPRCPPGYIFVARLGQGGMGAVVRARETALARDIAVKFVEPRFGQSDPRFFTRFALEAEAMARLRHPNIIPVYAVGDDAGRPFMVMEYAEGGSLADRLRGKDPIAPRQAAAVCELLSRAAHHAHERGVIHRDLKPSNILLSAPPDAAMRDELPPGTARIGEKVWTPRIADFGLVKLEDAASLGGVHDVPTLAGEVWGSPGFMSPEQARGDVAAVGVRTDVHALGAILYFLLIGKSPFDAPTTARVIERVKSEVPQLPRQVRPAIPADLETICLKALRKAPADRYATAADLADDLRRFLEGRPIAARPFGPAERAWRWGKRNRALAATLVGLVVTMVAGTAVSVRYAILAEDNARTANANAATARDEKAQADAARSLAENETLRANQNATEAKVRSQELALQLERAEWTAYDTEIAQAREDIASGQSARARSRLENARWDFRSWEHDQLAGLLDGRYGVHRMTLPANAKARDAAFSPDGRFISVIEDDVRDYKGEVQSLSVVAIRDTRSGSLIREFLTPGRKAVHIVVVADRVVAADANGQILGWNLASGDVAFSLPSFHHLSGVASLAISPDGSRLVTTSASGLARVWDARTATLVSTFEAGGRPCTSVAISGDATHCIGAFGDRSLRVWETQSGKSIAQIPVRQALIKSVAIDGPGERVAAGTDKGIVMVWDARSRELIGSQPAHAGNVAAIAFALDGKRLASAGRDDGNVNLWDRDLDQPPVVLHAHSGNVVGIGFSADHRSLMTCGGSWLGVADFKTWDVEVAIARSQPIPAGGMVTGSFVGNGERLAALHTNGRLRIWDCVSHTLQSEASLTAPLAAEAPAGVSPDATRVAIGRGLQVELLDVTRRSVLAKLPGPAAAKSIQFQTPSRLLVRYADESAWIWDVGGEPRTLLKITGVFLNAVLSGDGRWLAAPLDDSNKIRIYDVDRAQLAHTLTCREPRQTVVISHDGGIVAARASTWVTIFVRRGNRYEQTHEVPAGQDFVLSSEIHPDGAMLAIGGMDMRSFRGELSMLDLRSGQQTRTRFVYPKSVSGVTFSLDGRRLAVASNDVIHLYDDGGLLRRRKVTTHQFTVDGIAFIAGGDRLMAVGQPWGTEPVIDPTRGMSMVDVATGLQNFIGASGGYVAPDAAGLFPKGVHLRSIDASPDGSGFVAGAGDGSLSVWDSRTLRAKSVVRDLPGPAIAVRYAPAGNRVAVVGGDGATRILLVPSGRLLCTIPGNKRDVADIAWRTDSSAIAVCDGSTVGVYHPDTGQRIGPTMEVQSAVNSIDFDRESGLLAGGCDDGSILLWDSQGTLQFKLAGHLHPVVGVRVSPLGRLLLSSDAAGRVVIWDLISRSIDHEVNDAGSRSKFRRPSSLAWSPDGRTFAGNVNLEFLVWQLPRLTTIRIAP